jgi:hypothetical protein
LANNRILVISDLHAPYQHQDAVAFLSAIKDNFHAMSFHPSNAELYSAGDEFKAGQEVIWEIEDLFPKVTVLESNHGSMAYRKARVTGIPDAFLIPYKEILDVKHWEWVSLLELTLPNKQPCFMTHQINANARTAMTNKMMSVVQGHFHEKFEVVYHGNGERLNFGMSVGCMINDNSMAFHYNKVFPKRPVIGCGMIIDSQPHLLPMVLNKNGRWNKRVT